MELINAHKEQIDRLCEKHKVKLLYAFGSVTNDNFKETSDVDLLVQFGDVHEGEYFDNYLELKGAFEQILDRQVDLLETQALRNPVLKSSINRSKELIYG